MSNPETAESLLICLARQCAEGKLVWGWRKGGGGGGGGGKGGGGGGGGTGGRAAGWRGGGALAEVTGGLSAGCKEGAKRCISAAWRKNTFQEARRMEEKMVMGLRTVGLLGALARAEGRGLQGGLTPSHQLHLPLVSTQLIHYQAAGAIQFV